MRGKVVNQRNYCRDGGIAFTGLRQNGSKRLEIKGFRLFGRAKQMEFIVFDNTSRENELREKNWDANLQNAYEIGKGLFRMYEKVGFKTVGENEEEFIMVCEL